MRGAAPASAPDPRGRDATGVRRETPTNSINERCNERELPRAREAHEVWQRALTELEGEVDPHSFGTWLRPTYGVAFEDDGTLVVDVPNEIFRDWLSDNYRAAVEAAVGGVLVRFVVAADVAEAAVRS